MKTKSLSSEALAVLSTVEIDGAIVRMTSGQLDRKLYLEINTALEALGGEWNRKVKGHVFQADPSDKIDAVVYSGGFTAAKSDFDFFPTPPALADRIVEAAGIQPGDRVLEPSAGEGALVRAARRRVLTARIHVVEILPENRHVLREQGFDLLPEPDFMKLELSSLPESVRVNGVRGFDRIIMNPPFSGKKGLDHVERAITFLAPGGRLVSVLPMSVKFRQDARFKVLRDLVAARAGKIEDLPEGSFKSSGTMVRTVLVTMDAPRSINL